MAVLSMNRSDDYRRRADLAEEAAKKCRDVVAREAYEDIARQWRKMAENIERTEAK